MRGLQLLVVAPAAAWTLFIGQPHLPPTARPAKTDDNTALLSRRAMSSGLASLATGFGWGRRDPAAATPRDSQSQTLVQSAPPPAAPWAAASIGLACQAKLNAFCNDPKLDAGAYNATLAPYYGLFDHNGSPDGTYRAVAWRCYSHGCLDPKTHRFSKTLAGPPSGSSHAANSTTCGLGTDMGPGALQAICATCAGTAEGVSSGQCLPAPHILTGGPTRLPIQRAAAAHFTVRGNFSAGATSAAVCRINEEHIGPLTVLNASAASCSIPCDGTAASIVNQSAGCWFAAVEGDGTISASLDGKAFSNTLPVTFFYLARAQLGRRPYIDEVTGSILLQTDSSALGGASLAVKATLPCVPGQRWKWPNVTGGSDVLLPLSLAGLPARLHNDLCL